ncbi:MAG: sugar transferase [Acidobacteriaceae bacterium]
MQESVVPGKRSRTRRLRLGHASESTFFTRPSITGIAWAIVDVLTVAVATLLALRLRIDVPPSQQEGALPYAIHAAPSGIVIYLAWFAFCLIFLTRSYGIYSPIQHRSGLHEQRMTVQACLIAGLLLCGSLYLTRGEVVSRIVVMVTIGLTCLLLCSRRAIWRLMVYKRYEQGVDTRNVLIVGSGRVGQALRHHLDSMNHLGFRFKGYVALSQGEMEQGAEDVVSDIRNILPVARSLFVDEIFLSTPCDRNTVMGLVEEARAAGIDVRVVPDLYDGLAWSAQVEYVGQFPTIPLHRREFPIAAYMAKRTIDLVFASLALLLLSPIMLIIAIAIRMDSPGPILYRAKRIGRKGRTFSCFKFRTMVQHADKLKAELEHMNERDGILFKISNDPRITRIGAILRKYSLDELPQFYNVLLGDMSIVGPRPPVSSEVEQYDLSHLRRLDVLPGITGLWQVEARQDPSFDSYISLDTAYVENWSLWLDLKIIVRTFGVVVGGTGT